MSWGNKLLVVFIVFGTGILYLVYRSVNTEFELVEKDYYKSELRYQEVIDGAARANALSKPVELLQTANGLVLQIPGGISDYPVAGTVLFYCAYDSRLDKQFELKIKEDGSQFFKKGEVAPGNYTVKIEWKAQGKNYYTEKIITIT